MKSIHKQAFDFLLVLLLVLVARPWEWISMFFDNGEDIQPELPPEGWSWISWLQERQQDVPYWAMDKVVIAPLEDAPENKVEAAAPKWPSVDWDYRVDSGELLSMEQHVRQSMDRFDFFTGRKQQNGTATTTTTSLTLSECAATTRHCGRACGRFRENSDKACWCLRLWKRSVAYLPRQQEEEGEEGEELTWRDEIYQALHMTVNLLSATLQTMEPLENPIYLVVNVYDYPRLFTPVLSEEAPKVVSPGHSTDTLVRYSFFSQIRFQGGFPNHLESCREDQDAFRDDCCASQFHFPIFSWSVNPHYNFDILAPNRHAGSCLSDFMDPAIAQVPWKEKTRTVMSRASLDLCHALQSGDHRSRFCAVIQSQARFLEGNLNVRLDLFGAPVTPAQQAKAKFLILLDGAVAAFRSTWYLSAGSVILAAGTHVDMRTSLLRPYVHFIPFKADFSDFAEALALVALNDEYAEWVGENARRAGAILSQQRREGQDKDSLVVDGGHEADKQYWKHLLSEYQARYTFVMNNVKLEKSFTTETRCEEFQQQEEDVVRAKKAKCLGEEYVCQGKIQDGFLNAPHVQFLDRQSEAPPVASEEEDDEEEGNNEKEEEGDDEDSDQSDNDLDGKDDSEGGDEVGEIDEKKEKEEEDSSSKRNDNDDDHNNNEKEGKEPPDGDDEKDHPNDEEDEKGGDHEQDGQDDDNDDNKEENDNDNGSNDDDKEKDKMGESVVT